MTSTNSDRIAPAAEFAVDKPRFLLHRFDIDETSRSAPPSDDVRCCHVMGHAIDPSPQATAPIERTKTAPQFNLDVLQQIAPPFGIGLVAFCEPSESRPVSGANFLV